MTRLLVSVRNAREARAALAAGADLIDVKEPANGSLGAPQSGVVEQVVAEVAAKAPVSVALGEMRDRGQIEALAALSGVDYAKVGLAGCALRSDWPQRWAELLGRFPSSVRPVAVVYADCQAAQSPGAQRVLAEAVRLRCAAVLVDTFDKSQGSLLEAWTPGRLAKFIAAVRRRGMLAVVGGSLALEAIAGVASLGPDYVAVRGAVCRGGRNGPLDHQRVREAVRRLAAANSSRASPRPLRERGRG